MKLTGLDVEGNDRLADNDGLGGLLGGVVGETLLLEGLGLGINLLVVGSEEINVIIILLSSGGGRGGGRSRGAVGGGVLGGISGEGLVLGVVGLDVRVPAGGVGVGGSVGGRREGLEDGDIGLGGGVSERAGGRDSSRRWMVGAVRGGGRRANGQHFASTEKKHVELLAGEDSKSEVLEMVSASCMAGS